MKHMTRTELSEYACIRNYKKQFGLGYGTTLSIRTNGSAAYKKALHDLYTEWGFHPATVHVDNRIFDENERIFYIMNSGGCPWTELYTEEEKTAFAKALN